jgi:hypothetical protein
LLADVIFAVAVLLAGVFFVVAVSLCLWYLSLLFWLLM